MTKKERCLDLIADRAGLSIEQVDAVFGQYGLVLVENAPAEPTEAMVEAARQALAARFLNVQAADFEHAARDAVSAALAVLADGGLEDYPNLKQLRELNNRGRTGADETFSKNREERVEGYRTEVRELRRVCHSALSYIRADVGPDDLMTDPAYRVCRELRAALAGGGDK